MTQTEDGSSAQYLSCRVLNKITCPEIFIRRIYVWFKQILLARTVDIIKNMLTILKLQGLEWKQHAYRIPFYIFAALFSAFVD